MPENSSEVEQSRNDRRAPGRYKWPSKLFENYRSKGDDKQKEVGLATDVTDFLNGTTSNTAAKPQRVPSTPLLASLTAPGWPSAAGAPRLVKEATLQVDAPFRQSTRTKSASPSKQTKNKGLHVRFTDLAPLIIGEGGDEAKLPPKDMLSAQRVLNQGLGKHRSDVGSGEVKFENCPNGQLSEDSDHVAQDNFKDINSVSLRRTPTSGVTSEPRQDAMVSQEAKGSALNGGDCPYMAFEEDNEEFGVLAPHSHTLEVEANATRFRTRLDEGQEGHRDVQMWSPFLNATTIKHAKDSSTARPPLATGGYTLSDIDSTTHCSSISTLSLQPLSQIDTKTSHSNGPAVPPPRTSPQPTGVLTAFQDVVQPYDPPVDGVSKAAPLSLRAAALAVGSDALDDFAARVQPYDSVFRKTAAGDWPDTYVDFAEWIRAATWWFLKGRGELEGVIRSRPRSADSSRNPPPTDISQAHVDLAKAWWILKEVTPEHPELQPYGTFGMQAMAAVIRKFKAKELAESVERHVGLLASMRALTMSMKRNHLLAPNLRSESQLTGLDMRIWDAPAPLPSYLIPLLSCHAREAPIRDGISHNSIQSSHIPIGDTTDLFCYGNMFVQMLITVQGGRGEDTRLPCILSVVRKPTHWQMGAMLASQDKQVWFVIQSNKSAAMSWRDVKWKGPELQLQFGLSERIEVQVQFNEHDYNVMCRLHAHDQEIMRSFEPGAQEALLFETTLSNFVCLDPRRSKQFPSDAIKRCQLRLFEKKVTRVEGTGNHEVHQGYRLRVVTPPTIKTSSVVESYLSCKKPVVFSYLRGEEGAPALHLKVFDEAEYSLDTFSSVVMTFDDAAQRAEVHSLLNGTAAKSSERTIAALLFNKLSIRTRCSAGPTTSELEIHPTGLQWERIEVANGSSRHTPQGRDRLALPESLRLYVTSPMGTMTDRIDLSHGELQLRLSVTELNDVTLLRLPQEDLILSIAGNLVSKDVQAALPGFLSSLASGDTVWTWRFESQSGRVASYPGRICWALADDFADANCFQAAVTGFTVTYDSLASSFAISRRRTVVSHKRWESSVTRVQVIERNSIVQLVAFFEESGHGTGMNFLLKSTDVFESFSRSGKYYIRIVDAKFAYPRGDGEQNRDFLCLDMPEYPGQHDDIAVCFDTEHERDRFGNALPATVSKASRIASLRR